MNNYIVYEPSAKIREVAREALRGKWVQMFWGILIFFALSSFVSGVLDYFFSIVRYVPIGGYYVRVTMSYAGALYEFLVMGALLCGFAMFMLAFFRSRNVNYILNLEGFSMFGKAFCLYLLYMVKIALWSLLFIIPGIVATFRYSQCFYVRVDHPELSASQCINESKRLMRGNKGKLFCLYLSFFGWAFLAVLPQSIFTTLTDMSGIAFMLVSAVLWLPVLVVELYIETAKVVFYEIVTRNLVVANPQGIPYSQAPFGSERREEAERRPDSEGGSDYNEGAGPSDNGSAGHNGDGIK